MDNKKKIVIAISGKAGSGKTTTKALLAEHLENVLQEGTIIKNRRFSDVLYNIHSCLITHYNMLYSSYKPVMQKNRKLLIDLAKVIKDNLGETIFADIAYDMIRSDSKTDVVIIDDLRFIYELEVLTKLETEGIIELIHVRLEADLEDLKKRASVEADYNHPSETDLDYVVPDIAANTSYMSESQTLNHILLGLNSLFNLGVK